MRNLMLAALLAFTSNSGAEIVGVNEAAHVPQHPEFRLRNLATRARKWRNGQLTLTVGATPILPALANPKAMPPSAKYRYNAKSGILLRDASEPRRPLLFDTAAAHVGPFRKAFIDDLRRFDVWRTMDLSKTNGNSQAEWTDRPTLDGPVGQWLDLGWPWELQIEAANLAEVDLWICVPHMASDDYVLEMGKLFAEQLDAERTVYLEYSNECWNTGPAFKQSRWIVGNLADGKWVQRNRAYGKRAAQVWNLFTEGGPNVRIQRVLAGQAGAVRVIREAVAGCESVGGQPDVVSCAAYFNPGKEGLYEHFQANGRDDDHAFALMRQSIKTTRTPWWKMHGEFAKTLNKPLIAYEGGSHIAADAKHRRDAKYVRWLHDLNRDPRIKDIYKLLRETWRDAGGEGILYFQRLAGPTRFGSWGHREFARDDAPKNQAVDEHIAELQDSQLESQSEVILERSEPIHFDGKNAIHVDLDEPLHMPFSVEFEFVRHQAGVDDKTTVGICEVVKFTGPDGIRAHCDVGEPHQWAVRSRHLQERQGQRPLFTQNGSSPGAAGVIWHVGTWHHAAMVFDTPKLYAYLDDTGRSIQAPNPQADVPSGFTEIEIGSCWRWHHPITIRNLRIVKGVRTKEQIQERARRLGCRYLPTREELVAAGRVP